MNIRYFFYFCLFNLIHIFPENTQTNLSINYAIDLIEDISCSYSAQPLVIHAKEEKINDQFFYSITSNGRNRVIRGSLSAPLPAGIDLFVELSCPDKNGQSQGFVKLETMPKDLVRNIGPIQSNALKITYKIQTQDKVQPISHYDVNVIYTLGP